MCAWKSKVDGTGVGIMILRWSSADLEMHQFGEAVWPMCSKDLQDNVSKAACGSVDLELTGSEDRRLHLPADSDRWRHPQQTVDGAWGILWKNRRKDCSL